MPTPAQGVLSDKRVLIVEDDMFIGSVVLREMQKSYPNSALAGSAEEAKAYIANGLPAIIVLDIFLPGMNGLDFLQSLREEERTKNLKVLVVSNIDRAEDRKRASDSGAEFMLKAVTVPSQIAAKVRELLGE